MSAKNTSSSSSITFSVDQLGPAGTNGDIHVLAIMPDETRSDEERLNDTNKRRFNVSARLGKGAVLAGDLAGDFDQEDGESYLLIPDNYVLSRVRCPEGRFEIKKNRLGEQSYIEFECETESVSQAKALFLRAVLPFLDYQAYLVNCPLFISALRIEDPDNLHTSFSYVSPYREATINPHVKVVHKELMPVYALYRDAKNSHSDFYTFLCYHKILEGLLGVARKAIRARALKKKVQLTPRRDVIPDADHISTEFKSWVGKSIKAFFDEVMTPQFRNAAAHFITKDGSILNLSDPKQIDRYSSIFYVLELCVRTVVETHEFWLSEMGEA